MGPMSWTITVVDHQALAPLRPLGQVGMARVDGTARVPKGQRVIDVSAQRLTPTRSR
jgi:hypothetical protein